MFATANYVAVEPAACYCYSLSRTFNERQRYLLASKLSRSQWRKNFRKLRNVSLLHVLPIPSAVAEAEAEVSDDDEGEASEHDKPPVEACIEYIEDLYWNQTLNAKQMCTLMHHLVQMGHKEAQPYAINPATAGSGHFQRRLDKPLGLEGIEELLYPVKVPVKSIRTGYREVVDCLAQPAHEALVAEVNENLAILDSWRGDIAEAEEWIRCYDRHPVVIAAQASERSRILPLTLYMDGAEYNKKDGLLVFTVRFSFSRKRHLSWFLRKTNICDCGCGGWCSLYSFFCFIKWSIESLQEGRFPSKRHDGRELDTQRLKKADKEMLFRAVIVDICGDWKEFANSWGLPPWNSFFPCFMCCTDRATMVDPNAVVRMRVDQDYEDQCRACEVIVAVTSPAIQDQIRFALINDAKAKGRVLSVSINSTVPKLLKGDRITPSAERPDTHAIDTIEEPWRPFILIFWRKSEQVVIHHRNPLISHHLSIGYQTFSIDVLHCLHLGVFLVWSTRALHLLFAADVFATRETRVEEHLNRCALELMARLSSWYVTYERSLSEEARRGMTRVNVLTRKMLGTSNMKKLVKLKAAESRHFVPFVLSLLRQHEAELAPTCDYENLVKAGDCLQTWMGIVNQYGRKLPPGVPMELTRVMYEHNIAASKAGVKMLPKHHQARFFLLWKNTFQQQQQTS